jgi:hypothetical protein
VHGTVAERVNSSPNLLDVGEMGDYSSYTMEIQGPMSNPQYQVVSLQDLAVESSRAALLAPLTITGTVLENIGVILGIEDEPQGTCNQFIKY